jgi:ribosomal-protein-alanine N-acetyltransferase
MGSNMQIEQIDSSSIDAALTLLARFFVEHDFSPSGGNLRIPLTQMVADPDSVVLLCSLSGEPVGVATVTSSVGLEYGRSAEIEDLYVKPEARGQGAASRLIDRALHWCSQRGCSVVLVTIAAAGSAREDLMAFYRRRGFRETGRTLMEYQLAIADGAIGQTQRIALRTPQEIDLPYIVALWSDDLVTRFIGGPREPESVLAHFREYVAASQALNAREREWWWSVLEGSTGEFVGLSSLLAKDVDGKAEMEIGYFLLPRHWGHGYATEASRLVLDFAFSTLGLESVIALVDPQNRASASVAMRLGMELERETTRQDGSARQVFRIRGL